MAYQYTKPRGPIAAMYKSPGPIYVLPGLTGYQGHDARSTHLCTRVFQFGRRVPIRVRDEGPGPIYNPNPRYQRTGKQYQPEFSIYSRVKGLTPWNNPGPGTFYPETAGKSSKGYSPEFSFGQRTGIKLVAQGPSPDTYSLPTLMGKTHTSDKREGPFYSFHERLHHGSIFDVNPQGPPPGTYEITDSSKYKRKYPEIALKSRVTLPTDRTQKPPPGAHDPQKVVLHKRIYPKWSFGIRHSDYLAPLIVDCDANTD